MEQFRVIRLPTIMVFNLFFKIINFHIIYIQVVVKINNIDLYLRSNKMYDFISLKRYLNLKLT